MLIKQLSQIIHLLPQNYKKKFYILSIFMIIGMGFEIMGISLLIPALAIIMDSNIDKNYPFLVPIINFIGNPSAQNLAIYAMLSIVFFYFIKAGYLVFLSKKQSNFVYDLKRDISQKLFNGYILSNYPFHIKMNSSQLIRNVTTEVHEFIDGGVKQILFLIVESLVITGIVIFLIFIEPLSVIVIFFVLGGSSYLFFYFTKTKSYDWGMSRQFHEGKKIQHLQQALTGIKEVKLFGREPSFINQFFKHNKASAGVESNQFLLTLLPRIFLEALAVIVIIILIISLLLQGNNPESIVPILGVFAAAAFRILPSITRVLHALQSLRYSLPVTELLINEVNLFDVTKLDLEIHKKNISNINNETYKFRNSFELENIFFSYENSKEYILNDFNLNISKGEVIGFIGESGAGKSTLIDIVMGLLEPQKGKLIIDGYEITNIRAWQNNIGYVPQSIYLTDDTLAKNIAFGINEDQIDYAKLHEAIKHAQLQDVIKNSPDGLDTMLGERGVRLSGGQIQRVGIARALYGNPDIIILDEASSALDGETEKEIIKAINNLAGDKTIIMIAHRHTTLAGCNVIYKLGNGNIISSGTYNEMIEIEK
jgi:ATP-binding cassette, subfamily B, bacterial PglK